MMELSKHCEIRIVNLEALKTMDRSVPLKVYEIRCINERIATNREIIEMVRANPNLRFTTKYPDRIGEY